jgi:hypothetical protein
MKLSISTALASVLFALTASAAPTEAGSAAVRAKIDSDVNVLATAATRTFGKASAFCTEQHLPQGTAMDELYRTFSAAVASGSREALVQMARTDPALLDTVEIPTNEQLDNLDKKSDQLLQSAQATPAPVCGKLSTIMSQSNSALFKDLLLKSSRDYPAKRAQYCARKPKPADCN